MGGKKAGQKCGRSDNKKETEEEQDSNKGGKRRSQNLRNWKKAMAEDTKEGDTVSGVAG